VSFLPFAYVRGAIHLPELALWLDAHEARPHGDRVFVSHAHSDHTASHREIIATEATRRLMQTRLGGQRVEHILPFGETRAFDEPGSRYEITLLPAGHILGSAMSFVKWHAGSLLYTGDFKLRPGLSAEVCDPTLAQGCDWLIMETTFGRPQYSFPPSTETRRDIVQFCRDTLAAGDTAVLLGYSLGRAQELLRTLSDANLPIVVHRAVQQMNRTYVELGWEFPVHEPMTDDPIERKVVICPSNGLKTVRPRIVGRARIAVITGWAMDRNCRFRYQADAAFPLSDHADHPELIEFVRRVNPRQVFTLHGYASEFAQTLRELGFDARALSENDQLQFDLGDRSHQLGLDDRR
jgi:Cft2 family RNA processing exonuclease